MRKLTFCAMSSTERQKATYEVYYDARGRRSIRPNRPYLSSQSSSGAGSGIFLQGTVKKKTSKNEPLSRLTGVLWYPQTGWYTGRSEELREVWYFLLQKCSLRNCGNEVGTLIIFAFLLERRNCSIDCEHSNIFHAWPWFPVGQCTLRREGEERAERALGRGFYCGIGFLPDLVGQQRTFESALCILEPAGSRNERWWNKFKNSTRDMYFTTFWRGERKNCNSGGPSGHDTIMHSHA